MKTQRPILSLLTFLLAVTTALQLHAQPLSGTYTIDLGGGGDYVSLSAAVADLQSNGVSGSVTFNIVAGTYNEQVSIGSITGASTLNTITFQSATGDSSSVVVRYTPTGASDNYVIQLDGASHVNLSSLTLRSLGTGTYRSVLTIVNGASNISVLNCELKGEPVVGSSTAQALVNCDNTDNDNLTFSHNRFENGSYSITDGGGGSSSINQSNWTITFNTMIGAYYRGVNVLRISDLQVNYNRIESLSASSGFVGILLQYCIGNTSIMGNAVYTNGYSGAQLLNVDGTLVSKLIIANNMLSAANSYAMYISGSDYLGIYHNTLLVSNGGVSSTALYSTSCSNLDAQNNIFANTGLGYALYLNNTSFTVADYNNLYSEGCHFVYNGGAIYLDLASWQLASGKDLNSLSVIPQFASVTDLHVNNTRLDGVGTNLMSTVPMDIDMEARSASPCIGADEFTGSPLSPVTGIINVPGTYSTLQAAFDAVMDEGISGTVHIQIADGNYVEQASLGDFDRANFTDSVVIESASRDSSKVLFQFVSTSANDNFLLRLANSKNIVIRDISFQNAGASTYGTLIDLNKGSKNVTISNCELIGIQMNTSSTTAAIIMADQVYGDGIKILNNQFIEGSYGINMSYDNGCFHPEDVIISENQFNDNYYRAISLSRIDGPQITDNKIVQGSSSSSGYYALYMYISDGPFEILNNYIEVTGSYGLYLNNCTASLLDQSLLANNQIVASTPNVYGLYLQNIEYARLFHNTIRIGANSINSRALTLSSNTHLSIKNNNIANFGGGLAIYTNHQVADMDYNNWFTNGCYLGWYSNTYFDGLGTLQSMLGSDANSVSVNPQFVSAFDLHALAQGIDNEGTNLSSVVSTDMDGEVRSTTPSIGADEFVAPTATFISGTITVPGDYATIQAAFDDIVTHGITGTVTLNIDDGTYTEHASLDEFIRNSSSDRLIIQSTSRDRSKVTIQYQATSAADNYVLRFNYPANVVIRDLTLYAASSNNYGHCIDVLNGFTGFTVEDCYLQSPGGSSTQNNTIFQGDQIYGTNLVVKNNIFSGGAYAVYMRGTTACGDFQNTELVDNEIIDPYYMGLYLRDFHAPVIRNNDITLTNSSTSAYAIYLYNSPGASEIVGNTIVNVGYYGMYLNNCDATLAAPALMANNMVSLSGGTNIGIYLGGSEYWRIYHQSVNTYSDNTSSYAMYFTGNANMDVRNNIFASMDQGRAVYLTSTTFTQMDYNNHYVAGGTLGYSGGTVADLIAWQAATGLDANSLSVDPIFRSNMDLHILSVALNDAGTDLMSIVPTDIDGNPRPSTPYIGADEVTIDFSVDPIISPVSGCLQVDSITVTVVNSGDVADSVFVVRYRINGGAAVTDTVKEYLEPQTSTGFTFSQAYDFTVPGNYTIEAWIEFMGDAFAGNDTASVTVESYAKPVAGFVGVNGCEGTDISFTDNSSISSGTIASWDWDFGDGNGGMVQNPTHVYSGTNGVISVMLIVTSDNGCKDTTSNSITVYPRPVADFSAAVACDGASTQFTDASTVSSGAVTGWNWDFDGISNSIQQNPSFTFTTTGLTSVQLIATTNSGCKDTTSQNIVVNPKPSASYLASSTSVCVGDTVTFTNLSTISSGSIVGNDWNFDNGNTSQNLNAEQAFASYGTYRVVLTTASDNGCIDTTSRQITVNPNPMVEFTAASVCEGDTVKFTDGSTISAGSIIMWSWDFDDGNGASIQNPNHVYAGSGTYNVRLTVESDMGCMNDTTNGIDVFPNPPIPTISQNGNTLNTQTGYSYQWFLDGQLIAGANTASISITGNGAYMVVITDQNGCSDTSDPFVITGISLPDSNWEVRIFPNPAQQDIGIELLGNVDMGLIYVELTDMAGRTLLQKQMHDKTEQMDIRHLATGLYFLRLRNAQGTMTRQVPIEIIR